MNPNLKKHLAYSAAALAVGISVDGVAGASTLGFKDKTEARANAEIFSPTQVAIDVHGHVNVDVGSKPHLKLTGESEDFLV